MVSGQPRRRQRRPRSALRRDGRTRSDRAALAATHRRSHHPPPRRQSGVAAAVAGRRVMPTSFPDLKTLPVATPQQAAAIKAQAMAVSKVTPALAALGAPETLVTSPGSERWPVKTGTDPDDVAVEIVDTTVEEMIRFPRPDDMQPVTSLQPQYQSHRATPVESTVWRIKGVIIALKMEADGDYHLVVQGASGATMIAEIPHPDPPYVAKASPWNAEITTARQAADANLLSKVSFAGFAPLDGKLVPPQSFTVPPPPSPVAVQGLAAAGAPATFSTRINPTPVTITGVGFFDKVHGQTGVSTFNGIEIHPVLDIQFG